jgi:hypothetical protein
LHVLAITGTETLSGTVSLLRRRDITMAMTAAQMAV